MANQKNHKYVEFMTDTFGQIPQKSGEPIQVKRFTWKNSNRVHVQLITYGATIISIKYPNKKGFLEDIVPGFETLDAYIAYQKYNFGSTIGRYANFIKNGTFSLNKKDHAVSVNLGKHHFNGGKRGFNQVVWNYITSGNKVILSHMSPDGSEGFPGDLLVFATFELNTQNEFRVEYKAMSSKPTIVNLANHVYFNLAGHAAGETEVDNHLLMLNADCYTVNGEDMTPTGEIQSVLHTIYDFQSPKKLGPVLQALEGFDNNFCVNRGVDQGVSFVGRLYHPPSGRILEMYSNQYGVQFDTANALPLKCSPETLNFAQKTANCPYLRSGVTTFDMLDELYNKVTDIRIQDALNDYEDVLNVIQELQRKTCPVNRTAAVKTDQNSGVKRSSLTMETLPVFQLTPMQVKYLERVLKALETVKSDEFTQPLAAVLQTAISNSRAYHEVVAGAEKRKAEEEARSVRGKKGARYCRHCAVALQCQNYPDAANNGKFPSPLLKPGSTYSHVVVYKFWIKNDQSGIVGYL